MSPMRISTTFLAAASASAELSGVAIGRMNIISINNAIDALPRLRRYATSVAWSLKAVNVDALTLFLPLG